MSPGKKHGAKQVQGPPRRIDIQQDGPSASLAPCVFLSSFPYVIKKSKSTFVLKHDPSESNETTFEVARFLVFMLWHFFWKSLRESKSDFRENREK